MNRVDRKEVAALRAAMEAASVAFRATRNEVAGKLRSMADHQRARYENLPEALQSGAAGEALEDAATRLEEIADELEEIEVADVDWEVE